MNAALINEATNEVVNIIFLKKDAIWEAPQGHFIVYSGTAEIGQYYCQGEFMSLEAMQSL